MGLEFLHSYFFAASAAAAIKVSLCVHRACINVEGDHDAAAARVAQMVSISRAKVRRKALDVHDGMEGPAEGFIRDSVCSAKC